MQAVGQIKGEHSVYDRDSGQMLSATFMDYFHAARRRSVPELAMFDHPTPSPNNPLGVKGAGEAGTTGCVPGDRQRRDRRALPARHPSSRYAVFSSRRLGGHPVACGDLSMGSSTSRRRLRSGLRPSRYPPPSDAGRRYGRRRSRTGGPTPMRRANAGWQDGRRAGRQRATGSVLATEGPSTPRAAKSSGKSFAITGIAAVLVADQVDGVHCGPIAVI